MDVLRNTTKCYTIKEFAKIVNVSEITIRNEIKSKEIMEFKTNDAKNPTWNIYVSMDTKP